MLLTLNAENPSRALAYVRVSSQRQVDEGVSIEAQIKRIKEYARYKGLTLEDKDILIEKGVSGGIPIWERPVGRNLKMRLETGEYPHLLTMKLDRMFRLVPDALLTVDELANAGISLHIIDLNGEALDTSSSFGRFFLIVMAGLAEMERGLISERTQVGMNQLKSSHKKFTDAIYGWDVDENGSLKPNWYEQNIIDYMVWQIDKNGLSYSAVARALSTGRESKSERRAVNGMAQAFQEPFRTSSTRREPSSHLPPFGETGFGIGHNQLTVMPYCNNFRGRISSR